MKMQEMHREQLRNGSQKRLDTQWPSHKSATIPRSLMEADDVL